MSYASTAALEGVRPEGSRFGFGPAGLPPRATRLADAVRAARPADLELDVEVLAARAVHRSATPWTRTPYRGIRATFARGDEFPPPAARPRSVAEARVAMRRVLEASVEHAVRGRRRVAILTGGGLDSSALLALTLEWARRHGATAFAVALDFGGVGDDRPYLAAVERHLGCEVLRVQPEDAARRFSLFEEGVDAAPFTWPGGPMEVEALTRARQNGADLIVSGAGADELFDGNPRSLADVARTRPLRALASARRLRGFDRERFPAFTWVVRPHLVQRIPHAVRQWRRGRQAASVVPDWAGPVLRDVFRKASEPLSPQGTWDAPHHEPVAWLLHQEALAAGIDYLEPFLAPTLRAWVKSLEPAWLLDGDIRRGLFRAAVSDLLPRAVLERPGKSFFEDAFRRFFDAAGGAGAMAHVASVDRLAALGIVRPRPFADAYARFISSTDEGMGFSDLWPVLAVEAFVRSTERGRAS